MNIVLIGYRGSGKSSVSRVLSKRLKRKVMSIDKLIVKQEGKSIPAIVRDQGWPYFRQVESRIVEKTAQTLKNGIIDCGGGVPLDKNNVMHLKESGKCVLLKANLEIILQRTEKDSNRPALKNGMSFEEEQRQVIEEREAIYKDMADLVCDTSFCSPDDTVRTIISHFRKRSWI
ncbi:MAG: shikimate kinase [Candidatus Nitrohelix vancouverensis]|uniref:Shikimate kinase n=1 Tax=Candidatus Nitrohelix vancouverensis TaxID=2705534 RepID=A0A7T0G254_9BACT|nr:MAG: shikimate kinase [Candidatus Nitrohelix vancouverensis]